MDSSEARPLPHSSFGQEEFDIEGGLVVRGPLSLKPVSGLQRSVTLTVLCICAACPKIKAALRHLQQTWEVYNYKVLLMTIVIISILQTRKPRHHKEVKQLAQCHPEVEFKTGSMLKSGHLISGFLTSHLVLRCDLF